MQVRAFKLPPLPGKKVAPMQVMKRASRIFQDDIQAPGSISRERKNERVQQSDKQNRKSLSNKRPMSVRSYSRQSIGSIDDRESRGSSREKSVEIIKDKIIHNVKARVSMPSVTAKSWAVYEMKQAKLIFGKRIFKSRQIASLTKIMNLITIIELVQQLKLSPSKIKVKVCRQASLMIGTSAQLKQNYQISLHDLYFGMMLPSGNDAAYQIAQIGGSLLLMAKSEGQIKKDFVYSLDKFTEYCRKQNLAITTFLSQMNRLSKRLVMLNSHFANPHGLSNPDNYSCAEDLCKLCTYSMENELFRNVVKTCVYTAEIKIDPTSKLVQDQQLDGIGSRMSMSLTWENTNKMLKEGWSGIKTGITPNAGPCLAASIEKIASGRNLQFLVILIDSASMEARWKQVKQIVDWVISQKIYF